MVASNATIDTIVSIFLKYMDRETALRIARDLYSHVPGSKSVTDTFRRIAEKLEEED